MLTSIISIIAKKASRLNYLFCSSCLAGFGKVKTKKPSLLHQGRKFRVGGDVLCKMSLKEMSSHGCPSWYGQICNPDRTEGGWSAILIMTRDGRPLWQMVIDIDNSDDSHGERCLILVSFLLGLKVNCNGLLHHLLLIIKDSIHTPPILYSGSLSNALEPLVANNFVTIAIDNLFCFCCYCSFML